MEPTYTYRALITRVVDGDSYDVEVDLGFRVIARMPLRLAHIDTPEKNTASGMNSKKAVAALLGPLPASVIVRTVKPIEKYGRYLADVFIGDLSLAECLINAGFGKPYEGGKKA